VIAGTKIGSDIGFPIAVPLTNLSCCVFPKWTLYFQSSINRMPRKCAS